MLWRWIERHRWRHSGRYAEDVQTAYDEVRWYGDEALARARAKLARPGQRRSRQLVWQAVVVRLEAEELQGLHHQIDTPRPARRLPTPVQFEESEA